jgi:ABC-type transporter Mla maintaining outer membrane lipid asymmetry ATPase subunit MlaF
MVLSPPGASAPGDAAAAIVVELERVHQHVGMHRALDGVSLQVRRGDTLLIIGPNGAGKSLTTRLILGLDQPSAGHVRLFGQDLAAADDRGMRRLRGRVGAVLQGGTLLDGLSVLENLLLPLQATRLDRPAMARAARLAITQLQLDGMENLPPRALSLGQRRRAELARALINRPELLVLDGLSDGLDLPAVRDIAEILEVQRQNRELTLIATDNTTLDVVGADDRVAVLDRGRLLFDGSRRALEAAGDDDLALRWILEGHP